jgi:hypothetical protein
MTPKTSAAKAAKTSAAKAEAPVTETPADGVEATATIEPGKPGERRPITRFTNNGDWTDPFSGQIVRAVDPVCVESGAVRDGDEAYLPDEG